MRTTAFPYIQAREIDYFAQAAATLESIVINARHTLGNGDGGEAAAISESRVPNARHALGDGDGGEAAATRESRASNARHALGDGDGGEAAATSVFATHSVSVCFNQNGRKVIA